MPRSLGLARGDQGGRSSKFDQLGDDLGTRDLEKFKRGLKPFVLRELVDGRWSIRSSHATRREAMGELDRAAG